MRETMQIATQYQPPSPLCCRERRQHPSPDSLTQLSDKELGARCDEVMAGLDAAELGPDWALMAEYLNTFLCDSWPAPPWSGDQAGTVAMCLSLGEEVASEDSAFEPTSDCRS